MYQARLANLNDKYNIFQLVKESIHRQCFLNAPVNGFSDDYFHYLIQSEIENAKDNNGIYVVEDKKKKLVGAVSFYFTFPRNGYTFIRFFVGKNASEEEEYNIFQEVLDLCFNQLNYNKVNIELRTGQIKYSEVFRKSGFQLELHMKEHYYHNGGYEDVIKIGLTKEDFVNKVINEVSYGKRIFKKDKDYLLKTTLPANKHLLIGDKVDLTDFRPEDEEAIYEACKESDNMHFGSIASPGPTTMQHAKEMVQTNNDYLFFQSGMIFAIRDKVGKIVGMIGSSMIDHRNRNLMLSIEIYNTKERGKGYGSEAIRMFTDFAFLEMNMHRVYLGCFAFNSQAGYLYERLGFKPEGVNRAFVYRNGNYYNEQSFGIVKREWIKLRGYI